MRKLGKKILLLISVFICTIINSFSQPVYKISGVVKDDKGNTLPGATAFLSGTRFATSADDNGRFVLNMVPSGNYKLILKMLGYEFYTKDITVENRDVSLDVSLQPSNTQLKEVIIHPQKNRLKYLKVFGQQFVGESENAAHCKLLNPEVLDFIYEAKAKTISASADEPLIVINNALGFRITYYLRKFIYNEKTRQVYYEGYPLFEDLPVSERNSNWEGNRKSAYLGSLQHFITTLYNGTWQQQGFLLLAFDGLHNRGLQNNSRAAADTKQIDIDSLIAKNRNGTISLFSFRQLYLVYTKKDEQPEYKARGYSLTSIFKEQKFEGCQASILTTLNPIKIDLQGNYFPTNDLLITGYLGWLRVADILPYGYKE